MPRFNATPALCQALPLPVPDASGAAPEWVHLLPAGQVATVDGRGPYRVADAAELARVSLEAAGGRLPIDENHSTDLAAPQGGPSPARGWIVELEARADGIWGRVEWTDGGKQLMAEKAYRHLSPVIVHTKDNRVTGILRAALTNRPNLRGLTALNAEDPDMDLLKKLREALGLAEDADEKTALNAVAELKGSASKEALQASLQESLAPIAKAAGLKEDADQAAIIGAVQTLADPTKSPTVAALQQSVSTMAEELKALKDGQAHGKSAAAIDAAIAAKKAGVNATNRDQLIALHQANPESIDAWLAGLPSLGASGAAAVPPAKDKDGKVALQAEHKNVAKLLGVDPEAYAKTLAAEAAEREETV